MGTRATRGTISEKRRQRAEFRACEREKGEHVSESERTSIRGYSRDRKRGSEIETERQEQTEGMRESVKERRRERASYVQRNLEKRESWRGSI